MVWYLAQIGRGTIYPFIDFTSDPYQVLINLFLGGNAFILIVFAAFKLLLHCIVPEKTKLKTK